MLDPFSGCGTTCVVAAHLGPQYLGLDISEQYVTESTKRIADTLAGRRAGTDIAEDPELLRPQRQVGRRRRFTKGPTLFDAR